LRFVFDALEEFGEQLRMLAAKISRGDRLTCGLELFPVQKERFGGGRRDGRVHAIHR
jgi:hypothetical protein